MIPRGVVRQVSIKEVSDTNDSHYSTPPRTRNMSTPQKLSHKKQVSSLDLRLFEPDQLAEAGGTDRALASLERSVYNGQQGHVIEKLCNKKNLLEFVFSGKRIYY